jgi:hypothetical protein
MIRIIPFQVQIPSTLFSETFSLEDKPFVQLKLMSVYPDLNYSYRQQIVPPNSIYSNILHKYAIYMGVNIHTEGHAQEVPTNKIISSRLHVQTQNI